MLGTVQKKTKQTQASRSEHENSEKYPIAIVGVCTAGRL